MIGGHPHRIRGLRYQLEFSCRVDSGGTGGGTGGAIDLNELVGKPPRPGRDSKRVLRGEEQSPGQREIDVDVTHRKFLVDRGDRNIDTVDVDTDTPVKTIVDLAPIKINLLMRNLWSMQENAVLNDPAHFVTRIRLPFVRHVIEVSVHRRHAIDGATAHGAGGLFTAVDFVVRKVNGERVLRPSEGEYMDRGVHAVLGSVNRMHVQLARDGRNCGSWGGTRDLVDGERHHGERCDHGDCETDNDGRQLKTPAATDTPGGSDLYCTRA